MIVIYYRDILDQNPVMFVVQLAVSTINLSCFQFSYEEYEADIDCSMAVIRMRK
jgi:hypothetical protein